jgi:hypothetical protein
VSSIHARCFQVRNENGRTLVCHKSKGHDPETPKHEREHYDPDHDQRWTEEQP